MRREALHSGVAALVGVGTLVVSVGSAEAGAFAIREQSTYSQGASFAGAAAPGDSISSMFWNPAAVTSQGGWTVESINTAIGASAEMQLDPALTPPPLFALGNGGDQGGWFWVPSFYTAYEVNDQLYLGLSVNGAYGLQTRADTPWAGQTDHTRSKVFSMNAQPVIGWEVNDMLSVAVGAQIQYFKLNIQSALTPAPISPLPIQELEGSDIGYGFTAGLTFKPLDGTTIGLGYRSAVKHALEGTQDIDGVGEFDINADLNLPDVVTLGIRQRVTDQFTLLGGIEWTDWSQLGTIPINGSPVPNAALPLNYKDGWFFSAGGEYAWDENLTLRAGVAYEISPVEDADRSMRLPDSNRLWLSAGASYNWNDRLSIDAAYTHIFAEDAPIAQPTYGGHAESHVDILSVAVRYKLGG